MAATVGEKERFMKTFAFSIPIKWFDIVGYHEIGDGRVVKIQLVDRGMYQHYRAFLVKLLDATKGEIDAWTFDFEDYLEKSDPTKAMNGLEIVEYVRVHGFNWTGTAPITTRPICKAIEEWIGVFT